MPKRKAVPDLDEPWLEPDRHEFRKADPKCFLLYLLVDQRGAEMIAKGELPEYVKRQAVSALDWTLCDAGTKDPGW